MTQAKRLAPVGVLDSGLGGLSIMRALRARLPHENFLFAGDCGHAPWGDRDYAFIQDRCHSICSFLLEQGAKAIVLACNTATAEAADYLRSFIPVPVIGVEPAVKPAARTSSTRRVGVLATTRTITSRRYRLLLERFAEGAVVISQGAPGLMECVERGEFTSPETKALIALYLKPMLEQGIDTLVLGCTHYPFLTEAIREVADGRPLTIIEPGPAVAAVLETRLRQADALSPSAEPGWERFFIADAKNHEKVLKTLWQGASTPEELVA